ncbi:MAG TPA: nucleotidyltransferase family protein [Longimicrobiales bacterium]|nr:nucleotidyltransferase family protein [Longimicrobiales bacterium]
MLDEPAATAEMQLLFDCSRPQPAPDSLERIDGLLSRGLDWDRVATLAIGHRMLPLVLNTLDHLPGRVPAEALARMRQFEHQNALRMLRITGDALTLIHAAGERGIPVLPYKGPFLSWQLYGVPAMRQARDLDLVVRRRDVRAMQRLLMERGYTEQIRLLNGQREFMLRSRYSAGFASPTGTILELHWAFTNGDYAYPLTLSRLAPDLESMRIAGQQVWCIPLTELVLLLCLHGTKHSWQRLELLCSMAESAHRLAPPEWDDLLDKATARGVRRMVLIGMLLAQDLVGLDVPRAVLEAGRRDGQARRLSAEVAARLRAGHLERTYVGLEDDLFHYRARERLRDRLRFLAYRITTPSDPKQWRVLKAGGLVIPLHAFIRPFRLLLRSVPLLLGQRARSNGRARAAAATLGTGEAR